MPDQAEHRFVPCQSDFGRRADCFDCFNRCCNLIQIRTGPKHPSYIDRLDCNLPAWLWACEFKTMKGSAMSVDQNATTQAKRRSRPLSAAQERLFFGALFAIAALVQIGAVWMTVIIR